MTRALAILAVTLVCAAPAAAQTDRIPMGVSATPEGTLIRVWAPHAKQVDLVGDFNGWNAMGAERLTREGANGIWSTTLKRSLPKGAYRFIINGSLERRDPYARAASGDGRASVFYDPRAFDWGGDRPASLALDELIIYELHVGTYHDPAPTDGRPATLLDALRRLDHLVDLGVNCIQVLPITEFSGAHSWGYNPSDPFAVEQAYGGPDALKLFVRECHKRGIAVHLDIVHNHYGPENLDLIQFDGFGAHDRGGIYFYDTPGLDSTPWGPRPRYDELMVRRYVRDNVMMWLEEFRVDGFRWDSTINIRAFDDGNQSIPAGMNMLDSINNEIRNQYPHAHSIAEDSLDIGNFHASWDYDFHHLVMPQLKAPDRDRHLGTIVNALSARPTMPRVVYVDNHDEAGRLNDQTRIASDIDPGNPASERARKLTGLGAVLTLTAPGIPLLFMGNEFLESDPWHDDRPLDWNKRQRNASFVALHRDLIRLRRNLDSVSPALRGMGIGFPLVDEERKILVYWRWHEQTPADRLVVVLNLSPDTHQNVSIPFPSAGPWMTRLTSDSSRYGGAQRDDTATHDLRGGSPALEVTLPPYSARIFSLVPGAASKQVLTEAAPATETPALQGGFSMYASIGFVATDASGASVTSALKRSGTKWEGAARLSQPAGGSFRIAANEDGVIYWGSEFDALDRLPFNTTLQRLAHDIAIRTELHGIYRIRFDEESLALSIEKTGSLPGAGPAVAKPRAPALPLRAWTDLRGRKIEARLVAMEGELIGLERANGARINVKLETLSAEDRDYIIDHADQLPP